MSKNTTKGITISVTAETNAGGRRHMEDYIAVNLAPSADGFKEIAYLREQAYIGVFDGHGGKEAAKATRERLWDVIQSQPKFRSQDLDSVLESVKEAYIAMHKEMEPQRATWKKNKMGDLSTAGTTASTVIFRQDHIIVANVGDSTAVMAVTNPIAEQEGEHPIIAKTLTVDHKPEDPSEIARIEQQGGKVMMSRKGVPRVVWQRKRFSTTGFEDDSPITDPIPFLSVARSLGDFWSYCDETSEFVVSPRPYIDIHPLKPKEQKFIVIASDGLWNVMSPTQVVRFIWDYEHDKETCHQPRDVVKAIINEALKRWKQKNLVADNIAVLIAFLSEEEIVNSTEEPVSASEPTASCSTSESREEPPKVVHSITRLKPRNGSPRQFTTTLSPTEPRRRLRKRVNPDSDDLADTKRSKVEAVDSGLEIDSPIEDNSERDNPMGSTVDSSLEDGLSSGVSSYNSEHASTCSSSTLECTA